MSDQISLNADVRAESGKKFAKRLRYRGQLPAVVYGEECRACCLFCGLSRIGRFVEGARSQCDYFAECGRYEPEYYY